MRSGGYIALISVIIISVLLMLIVVGTSQIGFNNRFNILDSEFKEQSVALAEACIDTARLRLSVDETYSADTPEIILIESGECQIVCVDDIWPKTIAVQANPHDIYTNLLVVIEDADQLEAPNSWTEVPNLPSPACS